MRQPANNLLKAAQEYGKRGWSVIPIRGKKPIGVWKPFQKRRPKAEEHLVWFSDKRPTGLAVILGAVSGDLVCRDFDVAKSYEDWAKGHPLLAQQLPTVRTGRGYHIYLCAKIEKTVHLEDGELRGAGGYCCLPPSVHPDGPDYEWIVPLTDEIPVVDPYAAGLGPVGTERTEADRGRLSKQKAMGVGDESLDEGLVEEAIKATLPTRAGERNRRVFDYARRLKGIQGLAGADWATLRPLVRRWHDAALPVIQTKAFEETWSDFITAWGRIETPFNPTLMEDALQWARENPVAGLDYEHPALRDLVGLCRELQLLHGDKPFFLSCRKAGEVLGVDHRKANAWLNMLEADGWITAIIKGREGKNYWKATRYQYLGPLPGQTGDNADESSTKST